MCDLKYLINTITYPTLKSQFSCLPNNKHLYKWQVHGLPVRISWCRSTTYPPLLRPLLPYDMHRHVAAATFYLSSMSNFTTRVFLRKKTHYATYVQFSHTLSLWVGITQHKVLSLFNRPWILIEDPWRQP